MHIYFFHFHVHKSKHYMLKVLRENFILGEEKYDESLITLC